MKRKTRSTLTGLAVAAAFFGGLAVGRPAAADVPSPLDPAQPGTVMVTGAYRVLLLTDDGHSLRSPDEVAPGWTPLMLTADQTVEVTDGACQEIATPDRPAGDVHATGIPGTPDELLAYCQGAQR